MSLRKQTPSDFLKQIIGRPVVVKLNSGVDYRGTAAAILKFIIIPMNKNEWNIPLPLSEMQTE